MLPELPPAPSRFVLPVGQPAVVDRIRPTHAAAVDRQVHRAPAQAPTVQAASAARSPEPSGLSPLDLQVVLIARHDDRLTVESPRLLFGLIRRWRRIRGGLADPRLELLRRHLVLYRHGRVDDATLTALADAGYSAAQLRTAEALLDRPARRGPSPC